MRGKNFAATLVNQTNLATKASLVGVISWGVQKREETILGEPEFLPPTRSSSYEW